jgi:hypothetical protein
MATQGDHVLLDAIEALGAGKSDTDHDHIGAYVARGERLRATATVAETIPRNAYSGANLATLVSGRQTLQLIWLEAGALVSNIQWTAWTTAAVAPTNQWASLYSLALAKLAVSNDDLTTAWSSFSRKTFVIAAPYLVPTSGFYYAGVNVAASTVPSLAGCGTPGGQVADVPISMGWDLTNTGLTTPASAPATAVLTAGTSLGGCHAVRIT